MKPKLLQNLKLLPALEARLDAAFDIHRLHDEADPQAFLAARGGDFEGLVTSAAVGVNAMADRVFDSLDLFFSEDRLLSAAPPPAA